MKTSTKSKIIGYLSSRAGWVSGSELESKASDWETKASVVARRVRELARDGRIERQLSDRKTVQYRLNQFLGLKKFIAPTVDEAPKLFDTPIDKPNQRMEA